MSETVFEDLQQLANLGYQIRTLVNALKGRVPDFLIHALIEATTGYQKKERED